jgi:hypothetical protein
VPADPFLELASNLARFHREHEKFYARAPLEEAASLSRTSAALRALAERWSAVDPERPEVASPFSGAEDLNDERAIEIAGILFMEGEAEPAEISRIKQELDSTARENDESGEWLAAAMERSWSAVERMLDYPDLADLLGERHRIISNDWQAASLARLIARQLERARAILERLDLSPAGVRADLAGPRRFPAFLHSACELIDHASDLAARSATLVHENERRWRLFRERVDELVARGGEATDEDPRRR